MKISHLKYFVVVLGLIITCQFATAATLNLDQKTYTTKSKTGYFSVKVKYPYLTDKVSGAKQFNQAVDKQIHQMIRQFKKSISSPKQLRDLNQRIKMIPLNENSNTLDVDYKVFSHSHGIISVRFTEGTFFYGAAHPNSSFAVLNFDLINQKTLNLKGLFKTFSTYLPTIAQYARDALQQKLLTKDNKPEHAIQQTMINDGTKPSKKNFQFWNITPDGLLISFPPYQVAAYVYGPQEVTIPYAKLKGLFASNSPLIRFQNAQ